VSALLSRLSAEPGVESAAVAMGLPFTSDLNAITGFRHEAQAEPDSASMRLPLCGSSALNTSR
jgi:hypothetical protein